MRKVISIIIITLLMLSIGTNVFAVNTSVLTLDEVINRAIESSKQLEIDSMNISDSKKILETAQNEADNIYINQIENQKWNVANPDAEYVTSKRKTKELIPKQREYDIEFYKKNYDAHENKIKSAAYDIYYSLVKADYDIKYKKEYSKFMNEKLKVAKLKLDEGLISDSEYNLLELDTKDAALQLKLAERNKKKYYSKLYSLMGEGYHPDIKELDPKLEYTELEVSIDDAVKNALQNRLEIFDAEETQKLKQIEFDIVDLYYNEDEIEYSDAINALEKSKFDVQTAKNNINYEIRSTYNELLNMLDTIKINKNEVARKDIMYFIAKLKYNLKMITKVELSEANIEYQKANLDLQNSIINYIVEKYKFEIAQNVGTGINKSDDTSMMSF